MSTIAPLPGWDRDSLVGWLRRWRAAGLVSDAQLEAIVRYEVEPPASSPAAEATARPRVPIVAEVLGYLGGVLASVGLVLLLARTWSDLAPAGRVAIPSVGAALAVLAGALVGDDREPALERLRSALWLVSTAATAVAVGTVATEVLDVHGARDVATTCAAGVLAESLLLWRGRPLPVQQATTLAAAPTLLGLLTAVFLHEDLAGLSVWATGAALVAAGRWRRTSLPVLTVAIGAGATTVGALVTASAVEGLGLLFAATTGGALLALALVPGLLPVRSHQVVTGAVGAFTLVQALPPTLAWYARDAGIVTGLATWAAGGALVAVAARRLVRLPVLVELAGGAALVGGAALTGVQAPAFAPVLGIVTALALLGLAMLPRQVLLSVVGCVGLLVNVPWAIARFFPGEARAPLVTMITGGLLVAAAALLARLGGRIRSEVLRRG